MTNQQPGTNKVLTTTQAARELDLQPDQFRTLAIKAGLQARKQGRYSFWSEADLAVVRAVLEARR